MKYAKIILGCFLIFGAGKEYANASKQLSNFFDPAIIFACLLVVFFSAWLIGSGLSASKIKIRSLSFVAYFAFSFLICSFIAFISLVTYKPGGQIITSNGVEVDIAECMEGSKNIVPNKNERLQYCTCMIDNLTKDKSLVERYPNEFKKGKIDQVINALRSRNILNNYDLSECFTSVTDLNWTPTFEKSIKTGLIDQLSQLNISQTNDLDRYADCLIEKYKKLPLKEFLSAGFHQSRTAFLIDSACNQNSRLAN